MARHLDCGAIKAHPIAACIALLSILVLSACARADVAPVKPAATPFTNTFEAAPYRLDELDSESDLPRKQKKVRPILLA